MNSITVRQAGASDLDDLSALFNQYREFQGAPANLIAARKFLQARFENGESVLFIAHDEKCPIGFTQLYPSFSSVSLSRVFILNDLFVQDDCRRKGAASKLITAAESYAWSRGAARISLNVDRTNKQGQALYDGMGWTRDQQFYMYQRFPVQIGDTLHRPESRTR